MGHPFPPVRPDLGAGGGSPPVLGMQRAVLHMQQGVAGGIQGQPADAVAPLLLGPVGGWHRDEAQPPAHPCGPTGSQLRGVGVSRCFCDKGAALRAGQEQGKQGRGVQVGLRGVQGSPERSRPPDPPSKLGRAGRGLQASPPEASHHPKSKRPPSPSPTRPLLPEGARV